MRNRVLFKTAALLAGLTVPVIRIYKYTFGSPGSGVVKSVRLSFLKNFFSQDALYKKARREQLHLSNNSVLPHLPGLVAKKMRRKNVCCMAELPITNTKLLRETFHLHEMKAIKYDFLLTNNKLKQRRQKAKKVKRKTHLSYRRYLYVN